jgi:hypothetical protein
MVLAGTKNMLTALESSSTLLISTRSYCCCQCVVVNCDAVYNAVATPDYSHNFQSSNDRYFRAIDELVRVILRRYEQKPYVCL